MENLVMSYDAGGISFRWHGGPYIDLFSSAYDRAVSFLGGEAIPFDVINVWDYETGTPRIPATLEAFRDRCEDYLAADGEEG